jgi:hypothetical protein
LSIMCIMYMIIRVINLVTYPFNSIKELVKNKLIRN